MKNISLLLAFLFLTAAGFAQQQKDITVFEKKEGEKNIVIARNNGKVPYTVTLKIHATGMDVTPSMNVEAVVPAGFMNEMATLTPQPGASWTYGYEVSFTPAPGTSTTQSNTPTTQPAFSPPKPVSELPVLTPTKEAQDDSQIIVYSKPGCSRCAFVKKGLNDKGIKFKEVDITSGSADVSDMWMNLRHGGFTGETVTMPVVKVKGQLHYNIKDLQKFVSEIKS